MTPDQSIELHIEAADWAARNRTTNLRRIMAGFAEAFVGSSSPYVRDLLNPHDPNYVVALAEHYLEDLDTAHTFHVTAEMVDVATVMGADLEGYPLRESDLPAERGLVLLDEPLLWWDYDVRMEWAEMGQIPLRGILWTTTDHVGIVEDNEPQGDHRGISYWCLIDIDGFSDLMEERNLADGNDPLPMPEFRGMGLLPIDWLAWAFDYPWRQRSQDEGPTSGSSTAQSWHVGEIRKFVASLFLLMQQEVAVDRVRLDRPTRRRWQASRLDVPEDYLLSVVRLRRTYGDAPEAPDGERAEGRYSHRWLVRPHWRRIHKGTPDERAVYVRGHIKGPEDAPLVTKRKVTTLER